MKYIGIALLIAAGFALLTLGLAFLLFRLAFGARKTTEKEMFVLPDTDQYRPYAAEARRMIRAALALPYEPVTIRSDDGLTLFGRCYPAAPDAPWLLLFHGYRSAAERDFCGGLPFGMGMGCNVLLVDEQDIAAHPHAKRQPAAEIALRRAAVAVKQQEPRRVRGCGIAAAEQRQSVVRADRYRLIGKGEGRTDHAPRLRRIRPVLVRVRQDEHFLFGRFPRAERQPEQQKRQPERQERKARCDQQRDANVLHSRASIHRPRMLMTPCRAKLASAHGAASSMTARQSASSRLRAAMRSHCPGETGVTPK